MSQLVSYGALSSRVVLTYQVDLGQVILVLLETLLPVLLQHVVVVLQLRILALRQRVATCQVGWRVLNSSQVLLTPVVLQHWMTLLATKRTFVSAD